MIGFIMQINQNNKFLFIDEFNHRNMSYYISLILDFDKI